MNPSPADVAAIDAEIATLRDLGIDDLRARWRTLFRSGPPPALTRDLLRRMIAYRIQEQAFGGLDRATIKLLDSLAPGRKPQAERSRRLKAGTVLVREYQGERHTVTVVPDGFVWREATYASLSTIAKTITGTSWNGPRFFGLRVASVEADDGEAGPARASRKVAARKSRSSVRTSLSRGPA